MAVELVALWRRFLVAPSRSSARKAIPVRALVRFPEIPIPRERSRRSAWNDRAVLPADRQTVRAWVWASAVTVTDEVVTSSLGKTEFALPSPLDEPMRQLAVAPGNDLTASHPNSNWVFRGYSPRQAHPRIQPADQTQVRLQHTRGTARDPARADQAGPRPDHRRRTRLPTINHRALRHQLRGHVFPIHRSRT